jgi:fructose-1,6-bisphosphatase/inositol monophosphatase family enzyme
MGDLLCARLEATFPDDGIFCEDGGSRAKRGRSGRAFIVDRHDGTSEFLKGRRETSISVALVDRGRLVLGVVAVPCVVGVRHRDPELSDLLMEPGEPTEWLASWAAGEPLRVNERAAPVPEPRDGLGDASIALVSTTLAAPLLACNRKILGPARVLRCASIATRLAVVAAGQADLGLTIRNPLADWDFAGGQALLRGVGGDLVDERGEPITWRGMRATGGGREGYFGARSLGLARDVAQRFATSR